MNPQKSYLCSMETADYISIAILTMFVLCAGMASFRRGAGSRGFFSAEGTLPWWMSGLSLFMGFFWATYSMDSDFVTFKNLEVLDKWILTPAHMYGGNVKRLLLLSENGTNARSYDDADMAYQAAGAAWAMKKVYRLHGIDGIDWHNWYDNPDEVAQGLRIGLRNTALEKKPVWTVYQAAGTDKEAEVFDPYLSVIGISSWDEIFKNM